MKSNELLDAMLGEQNMPVVIELPNGQQMATTDYRFDSDARGNQILVIKSGKKKAASK